MMASAAVSVSGSSPVAAAAMARDHRAEGMRRSESGTDLSGMRRSMSAPQLRCSLNVPRAAAPASLKSSRSIGVFPLGSIITNSIRSFLFDSGEGVTGGGMRLVEPAEESDEEVVAGSEEEGIGQEKRANWVARILELRRRWRDRQHKVDGVEEEDKEGGEEDGYCGVSYESEEEEEGEWDRESFESLLGRVPWSDEKLFSQLAFLCDMAYVIPEIKEEELRAWYDVGFVTSSLEKKEEAAIRAKFESDSTPLPQGPQGSDPMTTAHPNRQVRPSLAYKVAASAASYVHSRAKGLLSLGSGAGHCAADSEETLGPSSYGYKNPEVAAYVAASTMTAVVAAEEEARQEAAKDLRSLHSSPCEWFVCDHERTRTRCFVIQGSDSLASWQANLFFEPTKFEGMEVLVHRGIYEAAKGIYEQFLPEIKDHLSRHGDRARLRFSGHSLGGSLSLLVGLMLLARGDVKLHHLLPVVTFGSPSVFCGGQRVLEELGLDEGFVRSVIMHRDIVPRAFSCDYPNHVAHVLKRLNGAFRSHPCLNNQQKVLYSPLGKTYILQPDDQSSPFHPMLPPEAALYVLDGKNIAGSSSRATTKSALRAFVNSPHPLETLSDPRAYGSEGTILRDHDCSNYVKALNALLRQHTKSVRRRSRKQQFNQRWPLVAGPGTGLLPSHPCGSHRNPLLETPALVTNELSTGV
ncbi:unnamed protein product [Musa acuminata subsp. malaccensis]|uniref:(wild Malaysian banana) hypothetical protein n=1 Tax=Musa acuminata subsp. malaccensis TaxID=214687 RepID=A0A8D7FEY2_MUSAM|nr:unnamed protein product [Musa acuminata subsp. malaccensis]